MYVEDDHVIVRVDGLSAPQVYPVGHASGHGLSEVGNGVRGSVNDHLALESKMEALAESEGEEHQVDYILWRYGHYVVGRLLHALELDGRFLELEGLWFLEELAKRPEPDELMDLARRMFNGAGDPMSMDELIPLLGAKMGDVAARFGLLVAVRERSELFDEVGSMPRPQWQLKCPPPMQMIATNAVYEPKTYEVLCMPGDMLSASVVQRLWDLDLLRAALGTADRSVAPLPPAGSGSTSGEGAQTAGSRPESSWPDPAVAPQALKVRYSRSRWGRGPSSHSNKN
jgi:hypothetical protein